MMQDLLFYSFAAFITFASIMVISVKNPVHAVLFLIFAFFNASGLFILLGAEYLAMSLIIVYVGAVAVLFLFVIMMLDVDFASLKKGVVKNLPLVGILGVVLFIDLFYAMNTSSKLMPEAKAISEYMAKTNAEIIGNRLYTVFFLPFQLAGLILLIAMIGAIVLTIRHSKDVKRQNITRQVGRKAEDTLELVKVKIGEGVNLK